MGGHLQIQLASSTLGAKRAGYGRGLGTAAWNTRMARRYNPAWLLSLFLGAGDLSVRSSHTLPSRCHLPLCVPQSRWPPLLHSPTHACCGVLHLPSRTHLLLRHGRAGCLHPCSPLGLVNVVFGLAGHGSHTGLHRLRQALAGLEENSQQTSLSAGHGCQRECMRQCTGLCSGIKHKDKVQVVSSAA